MAVCFNCAPNPDEIEYVGCGLKTYERNCAWDSYWYAIVWDENEKRIREVCYDTTAAAGGGWAKVDATPETLRKVYRYYVNDVKMDYDNHYNVMEAKRIQVGDEVVVIRGRKIKKGTTGKVFWVGECFNRYSGMNEKRAGIEINHERVFIPYEYLEVVGWEKRMLHGRARKNRIRRSAMNIIRSNYYNIPYWNAALFF